MSKIFVRERRNAKKGNKKQRYSIVAVSGVELKLFQTTIRQSELEKLAEEAGAEIVYLPRTRKSKDQESQIE